MGGGVIRMTAGTPSERRCATMARRLELYSSTGTCCRALCKGADQAGWLQWAACRYSGLAACSCSVATPCDPSSTSACKVPPGKLHSALLCHKHKHSTHEPRSGRAASLAPKKMVTRRGGGAAVLFGNTWSISCSAQREL